jgi:hypothetical protein
MEHERHLEHAADLEGQGNQTKYLGLGGTTRFEDDVA